MIMRTINQIIVSPHHMMLDAGEDDYSHQEQGAKEKGYRSNERVASSLFYE